MNPAQSISILRPIHAAINANHWSRQSALSTNAAQNVFSVVAVFIVIVPPVEYTGIGAVTQAPLETDLTIAGRPVDTEMAKFWGSVLQRVVIIGLLAAILYKDPGSEPGWLALGAVVGDLFHQGKNGNGNGNGGK